MPDLGYTATAFRAARVGVALAIALCAASWMFAGCADLPGSWPTNKNANSLGTHADLGPIKIRNVYVARPDDGSYHEGESSLVFLTLINSGGRTDRLTGVSSTHARRLEMRWDRACDGAAETVPDIPIRPKGPVPGPVEKDVTGHLPYYLRIIGFTELVRAGTTIPLTFHFERAGEITVRANVQGRHPRDERGKYACEILPDQTAAAAPGQSR